MNPREAVKETIRFTLINLDYSHELAAKVAEKMHDDHTFLEELEEFIQEHVDDFGENYGL